MTEKRGLVALLVIATVVIFVGLVWVIATYLPLNLAAAPSPTFTVDAPRVAVNCASPIAFWKIHPELFPERVVIGGQVYKAGDLNQIFSGQAEDLPAKLQAQLTAAYLNILSGADQSYIEATIFEAYRWLVQHPAGSQVSDAERENGTRLFNLLEAFNLGMTGVKPCEIASLTLTEERTATETATDTATVTPSQTVTTTPSETPTPTNFPTEPFNTLIAPTRTPAPTKAVTVLPTLAPTNTTAPTATNAPTNTIAPPPTMTEPPPTWTPPPILPTWTQPPVP
jgi:hypothetical protein